MMVVSLAVLSLTFASLLSHAAADFNTNTGETGAQVTLGMAQNGSLFVAWSVAEVVEEGVQTPAEVRYARAGEDIELGGVSLAMAGTVRNGVRRHVATLHNVAGDTIYEYQLRVGAAWTTKLKLQAPRRWSGFTSSSQEVAARIGVVGDLSLGAAGQSVMKGIEVGRPLDVVLHLGNVARQNSSEGIRAFLDMVEPVSSAVPYMPVPVQEDKEDMETYQHIFQQPPLPPAAAGALPVKSGDSDLWYCLQLSAATIVVLWTDVLLSVKDSGPKRRQLNWLKQVLAVAASDEERALRPWIIVAGHDPMYCSMARDTPTCSDNALALRGVLEPLLLEYKVDLYLSAKLHAYERTYPVNNGTGCDSEKARRPGRIRNSCEWPLHVLEGNAGDPPIEHHGPPAPWTAYRASAQPGYGEIVIYNATHLHYRQVLAVADAVGDARDDFWLLKAQAGEEGSGGDDDSEEPFLEATLWLSVATLVLTGTCMFVKWVHEDGIKRRHEALRHLRVELAVLAGGVGGEPTRLGGGSGYDSDRLMDTNQGPGHSL